MSFILDALRKSDARRQQSGAPGINSPEPPRPPGKRRRRKLSWLAAVLVLVVAVSAAVYVVRPEWLPQRLVGAPADSAAGGESATAERPAPSEDGAAARDRRAVPTPPSESDAGPRAQKDAEPEQDEADDSLPDRRRPIPADPDRVVRRTRAERESAPVPAEEAAEELERRIAAEEARRSREAAAEQARRSSQPPSDPARPRPDRAPEAEIEAQSPGEVEPLNEGVPEYLRAWELPLSVRRNLPELNLSIHVFSPNEAERFVLINGERYVPGDAIGEVNIVDISRDGAIVDFRSHRFLLEPR
ncbi:general secretion pathway protein GspB [Wenzhouxiangella sediminis]|uniref:general secretion pathway protein GspB n=1 Tax=Wenzhouxiangella sediminis TaxID=1792836 RepID=UPI0015F28A7C|nr:general secretion pathway protein GspB [Wenzhouxiangella sediminis]